jgi:hypothetical protein
MFAEKIAFLKEGLVLQGNFRSRFTKPYAVLTGHRHQLSVSALLLSKYSL